MKKILIPLFVCYSFMNLFGQTGWFWQNLKPQGNDLRAVSFCDRNNGWAVGPAGTVLHTSDGGNTWQLQFAKAYNYFQDVVCLSPANAIASGAAGLIARTTNAGISWDTLSLGTTAGLSSLKFVDANTGFAMEQYSSTENKLFKTTNGGATWSTISTGIKELIYSISFVDANVGYAAGGGITSSCAMYKTINGGTSWTKQPVSSNYALYSVCFSDTVGWAVGYDGIILKSVNNGDMWTIINAGNILTSNLNGINFYRYKNAGRTLYLGMAVGDLGMAKRSVDVGTTWTTIMSDWVNYKTLYDVQMVDTLYGYAVGAKGKIMKTTDGGLSWFHQNSGLRAELWSVWFADSLRGAAVGDSAISTGGYTDGKIYTTFDGGNNWNSLTFPYCTFEGVHFPYATIGCAVGFNGRNAVSAHTSDGGVNWKLDTVFNFNGRLWSVAFASALNGVAVGDSGMVMRTIDGGKTWSRISSGTTNSLWYIVYSPSLYPRKPGDTLHTGYYAMGANGTLLVSETGGSTWQKVTFPGTNSINGMSIVQDKAIYVGCSDGVYKSTTANVYTKVTTPGFATSAIWAVNELTAYAAGGYGAFSVTTNGGTSWSQVKITGNTLRAICIIDNKSGWVVGEAGTILKTGNVIITDVEAQIASTANPSIYKLSQNYPNPFNPSTKIDYNLPVRSNVRIELFDIRGARVAQLLNKEQQAGNYSLEIGTDIIRSLASGVYIYRMSAYDLTSGSYYITSRKMILLR